MTKFKITKQEMVSSGGLLRFEEFAAPEGFHFKESHCIGNRVIIIWEGRPTPPSLVSLCNDLVNAKQFRRGHGGPHDPPLEGIANAIEQELNAQGLRGLA